MVKFDFRPTNLLFFLLFLFQPTVRDRCYEVPPKRNNIRLATALMVMMSRVDNSQHAYVLFLTKNDTVATLKPACTSGCCGHGLESQL